MIEFKTPGVYLREIEVTPPRLLGVSVAGFVGLAERGPLNYPQLLTSWTQYVEVFGGFVGFSYLPYAVFSYFLNGGERCYVVRVAGQTAQKAEGTFRDLEGSDSIWVEALNEGEWGNSLTVTIEESSSNDFALTKIRTEAKEGATTLQLESAAGLAIADEITLAHAYKPVREKNAVKAVDRRNRIVSLAQATQQVLPAGSAVIGKGFKLSVEYRSDSTLVRQETFDNLSLDKLHERYFVRVINGEVKRRDEERDCVKRMQKGMSILVRVAEVSTQEAFARPRKYSQALAKGNDGSQNLPAHYFTGTEQGASFRPSSTIPPEGGGSERLWGVSAFEAVSEIGTVVIPDLVLADLYARIPKAEIPKAGIVFATSWLNRLLESDLLNLRDGQVEMLRHCEKMGDRFAILDSPCGAGPGKSSNKIDDWPGVYRMLRGAKNAALYYPWIRLESSLTAGSSLLIPPSGAVAGVFARTEKTSGPGKAPANELLSGVVALEIDVSNMQQENLNPLGVNCIRSFPGRGVRIWGARTLSPDSQLRYVNVRRVIQFITKNIIVQLQWAVFEPNDRVLWQKVVASLTLFLKDLFARGALAGSTPAEAFFVRCDESTNPSETIERGEMRTVVGFAPAQPAEFILLTITRSAESFSVTEETA